MSAIIRAYCPVGTNAEVIKMFMLSEGGYTTFAANGHWSSGLGVVVSEPVTVYECVLSSVKARQRLEHIGRVFLNDNRNEKAFLGVVIADRVEQVYITQE